MTRAINLSGNRQRGIIAEDNKDIIIIATTCNGEIVDSDIAFNEIINIVIFIRRD